MKNSLNELLKSVRLGSIPDSGEFEPVCYSYKNEDKKLNVSDIVLSVAPSVLIEEYPKEREIQIKVFSEDKAHSYSVTLFRGERKAIAEKLQGTELQNQITDFVKESSLKFDEY